jgi:hypothetical protein
MGYGSSSKGGGGSGNAGGCKKKSGGGKKRHTKTSKKKKKKIVDGGDEVVAEERGHYLIAPDAEQREKLLEQRRSGEEQAALRIAARSSLAFSGTGPGGATLGTGDGGTTTTTAPSEEEPKSQREARLAYFAKQDAELAQRRRVTRDAPFAQQQQLTQNRLDALVARFEREQNTSSSDSTNTGDITTCLHLLSTVLRNAATKTATKYRRLPARNDKLWGGLLCHPEAVEILSAAGFVRQRPVPISVTTATPTATEIERDRIKLEINQELDSTLPNTDAIAALVVELERLSGACFPPSPPPALQPGKFMSPRASFWPLLAFLAYCGSRAVPITGIW